MNETDLLNKGFVRQVDGSWAKRPVPVGAVEVPVRESNPTQTLDGGSPIRKSIKKSVVVSILLIGCRKKILDGDNFTAGCKSLRDAIATTLCVDDGDPRLEWEYEQVRTRGPEGVIVLISTK